MKNNLSMHLKTILLFFAITFPSHYTFSQENYTKLKITSEALMKATKIKHLINTPEGCKVYSYQISYINIGGLHSFFNIDSIIPEYFMTEIRKTKKGKYFFIEQISASCSNFRKKSYKITVE